VIVLLPFVRATATTLWLPFGRNLVRIERAASTMDEAICKSPGLTLGEVVPAMASWCGWTLFQYYLLILYRYSDVGIGICERSICLQMDVAKLFLKQRLTISWMQSAQRVNPNYIS
jgi:hypothetical protein